MESNPEDAGGPLMFINGVVCSWFGVGKRVREKIAAGHSLNETHPCCISMLDIEQANPHNLTLLHIAVGMGHSKLVQLMLENGADVNARDISGATPRMHAAREFPSMLALFDDVEATTTMNIDATNKNDADAESLCRARVSKPGREEVLAVQGGVLLRKGVPNRGLEAAQEDMQSG